jgi:GNAT superfamily N-acetyltransferase
MTTCPVDPRDVRVVPASEAAWADLRAIFSAREASRCLCQRFKVLQYLWRDSTLAERTELLREQTGCDEPDATATSGLVAYVAGEPAGWVAVEPRTAYPKLRTSRVPWAGRDEDPGDDSVWAATCFVVRKEYRGRGLTYLLARAAVAHAREQGARALEGYAMITHPGREITWGELHVGARQVFEEAGLTEVTHPTPRRTVMRITFTPGGSRAE